MHTTWSRAPAKLQAGTAPHLDDGQQGQRRLRKHGYKWTGASTFIGIHSCIDKCSELSQTGCTCGCGWERGHGTRFPCVSILNDEKGTLEVVRALPAA